MQSTNAQPISDGLLDSIDEPTHVLQIVINTRNYLFQF
jgi:hypothetical protein